MSSSSSPITKPNLRVDPEATSFGEYPFTLKNGRIAVRETPRFGTLEGPVIYQITESEENGEVIGKYVGKTENFKRRARQHAYAGSRALKELQNSNELYARMAKNPRRFRIKVSDWDPCNLGQEDLEKREADAIAAARKAGACFNRTRGGNGGKRRISSGDFVPPQDDEDLTPKKYYKVFFNGQDFVPLLTKTAKTAKNVIYKLRVGDDSYVGQAGDPKRRLHHHGFCARHEEAAGGNRPLYRAMRESCSQGEKIAFGILAKDLPEGQMNDAEGFFIRAINPELNGNQGPKTQTSNQTLFSKASKSSQAGR